MSTRDAFRTVTMAAAKTSRTSMCHTVVEAYRIDETKTLSARRNSARAQLQNARARLAFIRTSARIGLPDCVKLVAQLLMCLENSEFPPGPSGLPEFMAVISSVELFG